ncbi:glycosyltransferase [Weizmannia acidilactici]|uniref:glycosyltransferase n=1 Tax=Weizmannia acidilactici TaxID=2607726 RepID=UPI00124EB8F2|nr:glycosyltransferase [Weizmannia acidilactici]GER74418.1 hypothetical protein BpPP18_24850 [Weizmannia acidilactici]
MRIIVFDVPADGGGPLTILKKYYNDAIFDKANEWIFIISTPKLEETNNVKIIRFPWVKKSWIHRLFFDAFISPRLIEKYNADEILSLQNITVKSQLPQTLYIHQPLPFIEKRYKIWENPLFWFYQNPIGKKIYKSARLANKIIVQTEWMKKATVEKAKVESTKIDIISPELNLKIKQKFQPNKKSMNTYFYPASAMVYKNHKVIVEAARLLKEQGITDIEVIFTLNGSENRNIKKLYKQVLKSNLAIKFIGTIPYEKVLEYYSKSILLFPSYIETFGLPLIEARLHGAPILASDTSFSREILNKYDKVNYFKYDNAYELAAYIKHFYILSKDYR